MCAAPLSDPESASRSSRWSGAIGCEHHAAASVSALGVLSITGRAGICLGVEERSLKIIMLAAVALFVVGAIAEARDTHTVWGQGGTFWMLLGFAAVALEFAVPTYAARLHRR